jgi:ankyrin repeat protein
MYLWLADHKYLEENSTEKNPIDKKGFTPLHYAANGGQLNICQKIMDLLSDKNPRSSLGFTPLHVAATFGYLDICKYVHCESNWGQRSND